MRSQAEREASLLGLTQKYKGLRTAVVVPEKKAEKKQLVSQHHELLGGDVGAGGAPASLFVPRL